MSQTTVGRLKIESSGGKKAAGELNQVGKATQQVGKEQTRLGQASASAGRQFSAQANGLGGLVGAYAGAAANIFAITAAFVALKRSAEFEVIIAGTNALASSIGANGQDIINTVQDITKAQLSLLETAQTVNIGLAAGFNTTQIEQLSDVSLRASKALGRSLTDAFTRVSRGAAKLEPELLDELGIFTRIDPAVRAYADSVGRSASSLTNFERRQAFANAVITEGQAKFRDVDISTSTAAESFERLSATVVNLGLQTGSLLASALAPLADFISGNLSNALAGFGVLASIVGSRAVDALTSGIDAVTVSIENFGNNSATFLNKFNKSFASATETVTQFNASNSLLVRSNSQVAQSINQKLVTTQADIAAGKIKTRVDLENAAAVLKSAIAEQTAAIARSKNEASIKRQNAALKDLTQQYNNLTSAITASSTASNLAGRATAGLAKGISLVGAGLSRAVGFLFTFVTVASLAQLALDGLAKAFGFDGFNILETLVDFFKRIIDFLFETSRQAKLFAGTFRSEMLDAARSTGAFGKEAEEAVDRANDAFSEYLKDVKALSRGTADPISQISGEVKSLQTTIKELREKGGAEARATAAALEALVSATKDFGIADTAILNLTRNISLLSEASGVAAKDLRLFLQNSRGIEGVTVEIGRGTGTLALRFGDLVVNLQKTEGELLVFKEGMLDIAGTLGIAADKLNDFDTALASGALNAEKAAQGVAAIEASILSLTKQRLELSQTITAIQANITSLSQEEQVRAAQRQKEAAEAQGLIDISLERLRVEKAIRAATAGALAEQEKQAKLFDKTFGKPGEKLDQLVFTGAISQQGVAGSQAEKDLRRIQMLNKAIKEGQSVRTDPKLISSLDTIDRISASTLQKNRDLAGVNEEIAMLEKQGVAEGKKYERLKSKQFMLANEVKDNNAKVLAIQKEITKEDSMALEKVKGMERALLQITIERQKIVDIQKNANKLQKEALKTQLQNFKELEKQEQLRNRKNTMDEKQRLALAMQRVEIQKQALEGLGLLTDSSSAQFNAAEGAITIAQAKEDRDAAKDLAQSQRNIAIEQIETNKKIFEIDLKAKNALIEAQIATVKALDANTQAALNAARKQTGQPALRDFSSSDTSALQESLAQSQNTIEFVTKNTFDLQKSNAEKELDLKNQAADNSFKLTRQSVTQQAQLNMLLSTETVRVFKGVSDVLDKQLNKSLNEFFDAVAQGALTFESFKEGFKDFLRNTFEGIRKTVLEETLIKPIQQQAKSILADAFGLSVEQKPSTVVTSEGNALLVKMAGGASEGGDPIKELLEGVKGEGGFFEQMKSQFSDIFSSFKDIMSNFGTQIMDIGSQLFSSLSGIGSSIFGGLGNVFSGLLGGITGLFGFASGGLVHQMASGGVVSDIPRFASGGMMRDRVPALLEPGEFVMKRQSVDSIGAGNMAMMNATGKTNGNVVVNIKNEGTPQDATASQPRFDGEKMVIDIVTRDLRNNGPIRKSLRGGAA